MRNAIKQTSRLVFMMLLGREELLWAHSVGHVTIVAPLYDMNVSLICAHV